MILQGGDRIPRVGTGDCRWGQDTAYAEGAALMSQLLNKAKSSTKVGNNL